MSADWVRDCGKATRTALSITMKFIKEPEEEGEAGDRRREEGRGEEKGRWRVRGGAGGGGGPKREELRRRQLGSYLYFIFFSSVPFSILGARLGNGAWG